MPSLPTRLAAAAALMLAGSAAFAAPPVGSVEPPRRYIPADQPPPGATEAPYSEAVEVNGTLYVSGMIDRDPATGKPPATAEAGAKLVLDAFKATLARAGYRMDELVQVQIFAADLGDFAAFNKVYLTYFTGPKPARAFIGAGHLLGGAHFEVMGIAVKKREK